jgi:lysophospholipase L1-like esterase
MSFLDAPANADVNLFNSRCFKNFKPSNTRHLRYGLARVRTGTGRLRLALLGDSTTAGTGANTGTSGLVGAYPYAYPSVLASILNARLASASNLNSIWGVVASTASYSTFDTRLTLGAGWANSPVLSIAPMWLNSTTTNAFAFTPVGQFDTADIWYVKTPGYDSFTVNVDGGATLETVDCNAAVAVGKQTVTCALGSHTLNIARSGIGGNVQIIGIETYNSAAFGIDVFNWGYHGSTSTTWNSTALAYSPANAIAAIAPDVVTIGLGINDTGATADATFRTNIQVLITKAVSVGDCIIVIPNPVIADGQYSQANQNTLRQSLLSLAATNDLPVIDRKLSMESYTQANASGLMYDVLHPNKFGYTEVASLFANALISAAG